MFRVGWLQNCTGVYRKLWVLVSVAFAPTVSCHWEQQEYKDKTRHPPSCNHDLCTSKVLSLLYKFFKDLSNLRPIYKRIRPFIWIWLQWGPRCNYKSCIISILPLLPLASQSLCSFLSPKLRSRVDDKISKYDRELFSLLRGDKGFDIWSSPKSDIVRNAVPTLSNARWLGS